MIFSLNILWNKFHRTWSIKRNSCNDILQTLRFEFLHEPLHAAALQLENPFCLSASDQSQHFTIIIINMIDINRLSRAFLCQFYCLLNYCQCPQSQKIGIGKRQPQHYLFGALFPSFTPYVRLSTHTAFHQE